MSKYGVASRFNYFFIICSHFLYPKSEENTNDVEAVDDKVQRGELDGKYELHAQIDDAIKDEMKQLMLNGNEYVGYDLGIAQNSLMFYMLLALGVKLIVAFTICFIQRFNVISYF